MTVSDVLVYMRARFSFAVSILLYFKMEIYLVNHRPYLDFFRVYSINNLKNNNNFIEY